MGEVKSILSYQDTNTNIQKHKILAQNPNIEGMASVSMTFAAEKNFERKMSVLKYSMMLNSFIGGYITCENQIPLYSFTSSS